MGDENYPENCYATSAFIFVGGQTSLSEDEISRALDMCPTKSSKTPLKGGAKRPEGWKTWFFSTKSTNQNKDRSVEEVILELIDSVSDRKSNFFTLPDDCERSIVVTIFSEYINNTSGLSSEVLKLLSEYSFSLKIATYAGSD